MSVILLLITTFLQEFITSSTTLAALFGGLVAGILSDWTGRRPVLAIADIIFIGGAIAQAVCHDVWSMVSRDFNLLSIYVRSTILIDRRSFLDRVWCRFSGVYRTTLYSRALSYQITGNNGRSQVCNRLIALPIVSLFSAPIT